MRPISMLAAIGTMLVTFGASAGTPVPPEPDLVANTCSQCHGDRGISTAPLFPNLAAQDKDYLIAQLHNFRDHKRGDAHAQAYMWGMAGPLSDDVIDDIAAYFAALPPAKGSADLDSAEVADGKKIFDNGIDSENVPACSACHGADAAGTATIPRLAGQHREYLATQILAFRTNERDNPVMHGNVEHMTDDQIRAVAAYLASL
jgi:cytochrome c553